MRPDQFGRFVGAIVDRVNQHAPLGVGEVPAARGAMLRIPFSEVFVGCPRDILVGPARRGPIAQEPYRQRRLQLGEAKPPTARRDGAVQVGDPRRAPGILDGSDVRDDGPAPRGQQLLEEQVHDRPVDAAERIAPQLKELRDEIDRHVRAEECERRPLRECLADRRLADRDRPEEKHDGWRRRRHVTPRSSRTQCSTRTILGSRLAGRDVSTIG